jgi:hypothetical protein
MLIPEKPLSGWLRGCVIYSDVLINSMISIFLTFGFFKRSSLNSFADSRVEKLSTIGLKSDL